MWQGNMNILCQSSLLSNQENKLNRLAKDDGLITVEPRFNEVPRD